MARQFKESNDNPFHKEYGICSNTLYILKKCRQYCPSVLVIASIGIICNSVMSYYLGFFGKLVIDVVGSEFLYDEKVTRLLAIVLIGGLAAGLLQLGISFSSSKVWYRYVYVRMCIIEERVARALSINYEFLEKPETLDIHERASQATGGNNNGVEGMMHLLETLAVNFITVVVTAISVFVLDIRLVLVLIVLAAIQYAYHVFCVRTDKKNVWDKLGNTWRQMDYMERVTQDFDYAKDIRLFSMQGFLMKKQHKIFENRWQKFDYHQNLWFSHSIVVNIAWLIGKAAIYGALFYAVINKDMSVGNFTLFFALAMAFSSNLVNFLRRFGDFGRTSLEVDDFRSFMELDSRACNEPSEHTCPDVLSGVVELQKRTDTVSLQSAAEYIIEFKNVSYRYSEAEEYALKNLNLKISSGEKLAVVGLNGAGKTTMIKLLLRLYDPTEGCILLNGVDIRYYKRQDYYRLFSPVFQDVEVLAFPIAENISMKSIAYTDLDKAYSCVVDAGLQDKIDSLQKGILTELLKVVDEEGVDFSGGEKQKLALARALYKNAPIVVLDEPTSALDAIAEQRLYQSFDKMIGKKSAVYISHRLASTRFCDNVAMFKSGEMIEYGTHESLMEKKGEYARMFELQAQYYQKEEDVNE